MTGCWRAGRPAKRESAPARAAACVCAALALAAAALLGSTALAQSVPDPEANRVWGGCVLSAGEAGTVEGLLADIAESDNADEAAELDHDNLQVGFVVVYALSTPNDGQPLGDESGFTGPIICINPDQVDITAFEGDGETPLTETSEIPTDTGPPGADTVDILAAEEAFILQYQVNGGDSDGNIEKRICHTVGGETDCFIVFPLPIDF